MSLAGIHSTVTPNNSDLTELETSDETTFTQIGTTGVFYRKINPFLVQIKCSVSKSIAANTHYTLVTANSLPAELRPITAQSVPCYITASNGYIGAASSLSIGTDGTIMVSGTTTAGVGVSGNGIYCLI